MKMMWNQTNTVNHHVFSDGGDNVDAKAVNVAAQNNEGRFTKLCKPVQKLQILEEKFEEEKNSLARHRRPPWNELREVSNILSRDHNTNGEF